jgi:hypothetical protein
MTEVPHFYINESVSPQYPRGKGGDVIFVFGKTQHTAELSKIYTFYSYNDAVAGQSDGGIGPEHEDNPGLKAVKEIFEESQKRNVEEQLGIEKVYFINMGTAPTKQNYIDAEVLSQMKRDAVLEVYVGESDVALMNSIKTALDTLAQGGQYRMALFTHTEGASVAQVSAMTDPEEDAYIRGSRIMIKYDRDMQARFAAKVASTPYYLDPSRGPYRSIELDDITELSLTDADALIAAGIIPDWEHMLPLGASGQAEPIRAVSTAYRTVAGARPTDANVHTRRNVDKHWRRIDEIVNAELKMNDTEANLELIREAINGYLEMEKKAGNIHEYRINVSVVADDPYTLKIERAIKPVKAIYFIHEESYIEA